MPVEALGEAWAKIYLFNQMSHSGPASPTRSPQGDSTDWEGFRRERRVLVAAMWFAGVVLFGSVGLTVKALGDVLFVLAALAAVLVKPLSVVDHLFELSGFLAVGGYVATWICIHEVTSRALRWHDKGVLVLRGGAWLGGSLMVNLAVGIKTAMWVASSADSESQFHDFADLVAPVVGFACVLLGSTAATWVWVMAGLTTARPRVLRQRPLEP